MGAAKRKSPYPAGHSASGEIAMVLRDRRRERQIAVNSDDEVRRPVILKIKWRSILNIIWRGRDLCSNRLVADKSSLPDTCKRNSAIGIEPSSGKRVIRSASISSKSSSH